MSEKGESVKGETKLLCYGVPLHREEGGDSPSCEGEGTYDGESDRILLGDGGSISLPVPGRHFAHNALGIHTLLMEIRSEGVLPELSRKSPEEILKALNTFPGVERRIEPLGTVNGARIFDDYGHHPTEIRAVLGALRRRMEGRGNLRVLFQPHRYTRTSRYLEEFAKSLLLADEIYLLPLYTAGEAPIPGVDSSKLLDRIGQLDELKRPLRLLDGDLSELFQRLHSEDVVISLGAGSISGMVREHLSVLRMLNK